MDYSPANLTELMSQHGLRRVDVAAVCDVSERAVDHWCKPQGTSDHRNMPADKWVLFRVAYPPVIERPAVSVDRPRPTVQLLAEVDPLTMLRILDAQPAEMRNPLERQIVFARAWGMHFNSSDPDDIAALIDAHCRVTERGPAGSEWWVVMDQLQRRQAELAGFDVRALVAEYESQSTQACVIP